MERSEKEAKVATLHQALAGAQLVVIAHQQGMTVAQSTDLRRRMRAAGADFRVTKNRLARIALKGTQFEGLSDLFIGPTAICVSEDAIAAAKVAVDYAKDNDRLVIRGGGLGDKVLDAAGVTALAKLPSLGALRAKLVGLLQTPASRLVGVLQAPGGQIARVLAARAKQGEAA